jgi:hypothetical protein
MLPLRCLLQVFVQQHKNGETKSTIRQALNPGQKLPEAVDLQQNITNSTAALLSMNRRKIL